MEEKKQRKTEENRVKQRKTERVCVCVLFFNKREVLVFVQILDTKKALVGFGVYKGLAQEDLNKKMMLFLI